MNLFFTELLLVASVVTHIALCYRIYKGNEQRIKHGIVTKWTYKSYRKLSIWVFICGLVAGNMLDIAHAKPGDGTADIGLMYPIVLPILIGLIFMTTTTVHNYSENKFIGYKHTDLK
jgi:hypothetical protein